MTSYIQVDKSKYDMRMNIYCKRMSAEKKLQSHESESKFWTYFNIDNIPNRF